MQTPQETPQERPLGAQISHMLKEYGVEVIFGIPGVHNIEMYRGIEEAGISHILARHEQGVGFMADGYARACGKPGVAYVITGPGLTNIMTPMGQAYSDSVPMLVLSSCLDEVAAQRGQLHQMLDQEAAAACVCDWSETARTVDAAYGLIDRAFAEFTARRPRPKHIQVPIALLGSPASAPPAKMRRSPAPGATPLGLSMALRVLSKAKRPLFIFGGGAARASESARRVCTHLAAASFTTHAGRGIIAPDDPLHFGAALAWPESAALIASADAVIVVGSELADVDLWRRHLGHEAPMVRVDIAPESLSDTARADWHVQADAGDFMAALSEAYEAEPARASGWSPEGISTARACFLAETDAARPGIAPICAALAAGLPEDVMYYSDMTQFAYVAKEVWPMRRPGHWHHPFGFGTLGYALPAAIGGAVARPGLPTMAIAGDYGFQYTLQELGVAVELGLSLPILLWDNAKLKEIEDSMVGAQIAPNAVTARNPDFLALARAYGAEARQPENLNTLLADINAAFTAGVPTLIRVRPEIRR